MLGSILTKELLQELGRQVGFILGTLSAWMFAQSKAQWDRIGNTCTLETVGSSWVQGMGPLSRVSADLLINWKLGVRMELEGEIPSCPLLGYGPS